MASFRGVVLTWKGLSERVVTSIRELRSVCRGASVAAPAPVPVPVATTPSVVNRAPVRTGHQLFQTRQFTTYSQSNPHARYQLFRYKTNFFNHFHTRASPIFPRLKCHSFVFHNFSQAYSNSYRLKLHHGALKFTTNTFFNRVRRLFGLPISGVNTNLFLAQPTIGLDIRLNQSLSPENHRITILLAKRELYARQVKGCYLEFRLDCKVAIPESTLFTEETQSEIKRLLSIQRRRIAIIEENLDKLAEIGEVPITCDDKVIRFYFPNCDRQRLEVLLMEREITGGVIVEDFATEVEASSLDVSNWDVLSLSGYLTDSLATSADVDVLSSNSSQELFDSPLVTIGQDIIIPNEDVVVVNDYHWN